MPSELPPPPLPSRASQRTRRHSSERNPGFFHRRCRRCRGPVSLLALRCAECGTWFPRWRSRQLKGGRKLVRQAILWAVAAVVLMAIIITFLKLGDLAP